MKTEIIRKTERHNTEVIMTSHEVAQLLKVSIGAVRRWSRSGKLTGYRLGGRGDWRYLQNDVLAFLYNFGGSLMEGGDAIDKED